MGITDLRQQFDYFFSKQKLDTDEISPDTLTFMFPSLLIWKSMRMNLLTKPKKIL